MDQNESNLPIDSDILIVDDNREVVKLLEAILKAGRYNTRSALNGEQALQCAKEKLPSLILLDLYMPGIDGFEVCKELKANDTTSDIPVIIISASRDMNDAVKAFKSGAVDYIGIPFNKDEVLARVKTHFSLQKTQVMLKSQTKLLKNEIAKLTATEKAFKEQDFVLRKSQRIGQIGSYILDMVNDTLITSETFDEILGITADTEKKLASWKASVHPGQQDEVSEYFLQAVNGKEKGMFDKEYRIIRPNDKQVRWVWGRGEFAYDTKGNPIQMIGTMQDITERKQFEKKLMTDERTFKELFDDAPVGYHEINAEGKITKVNNTELKMLQYTAQEMLGQYAWMFTVKSEFVKEKILQNFSGIANGAENYECEFMKKDKTIITGLLKEQFLYDDTNRTIGSRAAFQDITERKENENRLKISESSYRRLFESAKDGILILDAVTGSIKDVNPFLENLLGYSHKEFMGKKLWEIGAFSDVLSSKIAFAKLQSQKYIRFENLPLKKKNGACVNVEFVSNVYLVDGVKVIQCNIRDITERVSSALQLTKLSNAVAQSPASIVITDLQGNIEYVNKTFEDTTGYSAAEMLHQNSKILKTGHTKPEEYRVMWDIILSGGTWRGEFLNKKKNGQEYWEDATITPIRDKNGVMINFLAVKVDITEKKQRTLELVAAKEKAEEMSRLKSSFLANMSHELRTPMIGILGYSEILTAESRDPETRTSAAIIHQSGRRLMDTLNLILDLSRVEAGKLEIVFSKFDMVKTVKDVCDLFDGIANKKSLFLKVETKYPSLEINLGLKIFREIINNLVNNALKFTSHGGVLVEIYTEISGSNEHAIVKIKDTGVGIAKENIPLIWEEFRQVSEGRDRGFEGTGLGLTITKKFVEKMGGTITVESELTVGSVFKVSFPMLESTHTIASQDKASNSQVAPLFIPIMSDGLPKILYVEDDPIAAKLVKQILGKICIVDVVVDSKQAIEKAKSMQYAAVLMDINLGLGTDGLKTAKFIKQIDSYKETPIVAITAFAMVGDKEEFLAAGCTHYISKPFEKKELIEMISGILQS
jgi:PAS domain S-box-containing protein